MKYRRLSNDELALLEKEFIQFLVVNGVSPDEWELWKKSKPIDIEVWIEKFSDIVIESTIQKITYLEYRESHQLLLFKTNIEDIELVTLNSHQLDLMTVSTKDMNVGFENFDGLSLSFKNKLYRPNREEELFRMLQTGALISDGKLFETLKHLVIKKKI